MSSINYAALAGGGTEPPEGMHDAYLIRARLQIGQRDFVVTEWQAGPFYWETLFGFEGQRMQFTQDALDGLGIDRSTVTNDDELEAELARVQGSQFRVRVTRNGRFVNTDIVGAATRPAQTPPAQTDIPLPDVSAPPEPAQASLVGPNGASDDDLEDIPF